MASLSPIRIPILGVNMYAKEFDKLTKKVKTVGRSIEKIGTSITKLLTVPIIGVGIASLKMSKDFNAAMANVGTLIPGESKKLEGYKTGVLALADATGKASTMIAEGLYETVSAFGDAEDPIKRLGLVTKMSVAGISSVKEALDLVSAVTKGYGDTSYEAMQRVSDLSFMTVKLGKTSFAELAAAIGNAVPLATTLNIKQKELYTSFATLTGVTGGAAEVSTQLASAFGAFIRPTTAMTKAVDKLGYSSTTTMIESIGLMESLKLLWTQSDKNKIAFGKLITRKEGLNAALTLLGPQAETFTKKLALMGKAAGATDAAYKEQTDGINEAGFAFDRFIEKTKTLAIKIGDKLAPALLRILEPLDKLVDRLSNVSEESLTTGIKIAGFVATLGPAIFAVGSLTTAVSTAMTIIGGAGGLAGLAAIATGPIGLAVAAIAGLTAAVIYFWDELEPMRTALIVPLNEAFRELVDIFVSGTNDLSGFSNVLKGVVSLLAKMFAPVLKLGTSLALLPLRVIIRQFKAVLNIVGVVSSAFNVVGKALNVVGKAVKYVSVWMSTLWKSFTEGTTIGRGIAFVFDKIGGAISTVIELVKEAWNNISPFFEDIGVVFDALGMRLDKAIARQENKKRLVGVEYSNVEDELMSDGTLDVNQTITDRLGSNKSTAAFNITLEGLPEGANAKVTDKKGITASIATKKGPKGPILEGAV